MNDAATLEKLPGADKAGKHGPTGTGYSAAVSYTGNKKNNCASAKSLFQR